jgi:hypothetical protein
MAAKNKKETRVDGLMRSLKNHPVIAVLVVAAIAIIGVGSVTDAISKIRVFFSPSSESPGDTSLAITLPDNVALRDAIDLVLQQRQASARFDPSCSETMLGRRLRGGSVSGKGVEAVIVSFTDRLVDRLPAFQLHVQLLERGRYDIGCST